MKHGFRPRLRINSAEEVAARIRWQESRYRDVHAVQMEGRLVVSKALLKIMVEQNQGEMELNEPMSGSITGLMSGMPIVVSKFLPTRSIPVSDRQQKRRAYMRKKRESDKYVKEILRQQFTAFAGQSLIRPEFGARIAE